MRTTCPKCNRALTIKEAIQSSCNKCASMEQSRDAIGARSSSIATIKTNFDALISEELKKRSFKSAA